MGRAKKSILFILVMIMLAAVFAVSAILSAKNAYKERKETESFSEVDYYSMQEYSEKNVKAVLKALKSGKKESIEEMMVDADADGLDDVFEFADWSEMDTESAVWMGAGSLSPAPDADGKMDMSERVIADVGGEKYVIFVETLTSRWGRTEDGISAIAVTTFEHFDAIDFSWNGGKDDYSVRAGKLFWPKNDPEAEDDEDADAE